jgi:ferric-dicitrate binding protein FerR (iron transport regulator)
METDSKQTKDIQRILEMTETLLLQRKTDLDRRWKYVQGEIRFLRRRRRVLLFLRNTAAILFIPLLMAGGLYVKFLENRTSPAPVEQITVTVAHGQIGKIVLPDLSEVWLNSGSSLAYPQRFTGDTRTVRLSGEAYFAVKADPKHRFDVQTDEGLTVSACGTEFNINAHPGDSLIKVTLAQGLAEVVNAGPANPVALRPGQQLAFYRTDRTVACSDVNLYVETAWREGKLVFRRAGMAEIVKQLSRRFNVHIELEDERLHDYEYSATFTVESIQEILSLLEKSAPVRCTIIEPKQNQDFAYSKRTVIIRSKK